VDACLHHLQGKTERVKPAEQLELLREFYRDKASMRARHLAGARLVRNFDFNNTYQYVINREETQLQWLRDAITDLGGPIDEIVEPSLDPQGKPDDVQARIVGEDRDAAKAFVERWRDRIEKVTNARNRTMLRVIIGETLEHARFFDQILAGRLDVLGRTTDGARTQGAVMPTRWVPGR
jgi:hypothetical protein